MELLKIQKQKPMTIVLISLIPIILFSTLIFGIKVLILLIINSIVAYICEYLFLYKKNEKVSEAVFVTSFLYTLTLPPTIPLYISLIGIVFAIVIGKMVFGGFGRNIFNPALTGRAFIYINFGVLMTSKWVTPIINLESNFSINISDFINKLIKIKYDSITSATPLVKPENFNLLSLITGFIPGSIGETSAIIIIICGIFLLIKKVANIKSVFHTLLSFLIFQTILYLINKNDFMNPIYAIFSGGFLFGLFFMVTDPVSSPNKDKSKILYGIIIGFLTVLIREFANWREGMMFAILFGNMIAPTLDILFVKK
ncbi:MAG: RnfABCDGE type electron transport complex subunit D [Spirochaetes bacterium]|nr:RnfABCDGE type electron transport complex subunit D [Spirochaetota bacterium]